jgi:hypothetical protein
VCEGLLENEFEPDQQSGKARIAPKTLQVGVSAQSLETPITQLQSSLERIERMIDHPQDRVSASEVVPGNFVVWNKADEPTVKLESPGVKSLCGEVLGVKPNRVDEIGISLKDLTDEFKLKIELALLAKSAGRGLRARAIRW